MTKEPIHILKIVVATEDVGALNRIHAELTDHLMQFSSTVSSIKIVRSTNWK